MADDLNTTEKTEELPEAIFEDTDVSSEIIAACNALETVASIDTAIMTKADDQRKRRIIRKSLAIIDSHISYLYDCIFDDGDKDDE